MNIITDATVIESLHIDVRVASFLDFRNGVRGQITLDGDRRAITAECSIADRYGSHVLRQKHRIDGTAAAHIVITAEREAADFCNGIGQHTEIQHAVLRQSGGHKGIVRDLRCGPVCKIRIGQIIEFCKRGRRTGEIRLLRIVHLGDQTTEEQIALAVAAPAVAQRKVWLLFVILAMGGGITARLDRGDPSRVLTIIMEADIIVGRRDIRRMEDHGAVRFRLGAETVIQILRNITAIDRFLCDFFDFRIGRRPGFFHCRDQSIDLSGQTVVSKGDCVLGIIVLIAGITFHSVIPRAVVIVTVCLIKYSFLLRGKVPLQPFYRCGLRTFAVLTFVRKICIFRPRIEDDAVIAAGLVLPVYCPRCRWQ